jgi:hypothetical protein
MVLANHEAPMLTSSRTISEAQVQRRHWTPVLHFSDSNIQSIFSHEIDSHSKDRNNEDVIFRSINVGCPARIYARS